MSDTPHRPPAEQAGEQLTSLARTESALAQAGDRRPGAPAPGGSLNTGGILLLWAAPVLVVTALVVLTRAMPLWAAVLSAAAGLVLVAVVLALAGRSRRRRAGGDAPGCPDPAASRAVNGPRAEAAEPGWPRADTDPLSKPVADWPDAKRTSLP
ncbi:phage holin family protein [Catellatospora sp. NPDC049609]|uniref:phage holin family protein n=1 Tax=Catellatospora sp. NPDC049609 TaxID=3155505 RepID=UPI00343489DD